MSTITDYELKQITETFFKEKGTFSIDNVISLMKKAYETGYTKGNLNGKLEKSFPTVKALTPEDLKFTTGNGLEWYKTPFASLNAASLDETLKKCQL